MSSDHWSRFSVLETPLGLDVVQDLLQFLVFKTTLQAEIRRTRSVTMTSQSQKIQKLYRSSKMVVV